MTSKPVLSIWTHPEFWRHETGPGHPEQPARLDAILEGVKRAGLRERLQPPPQHHPETQRIIEKVHSAAYAAQVEQAVVEGARFFHSFDNPISPATASAAHTAVSVALHAAEDIWIRDRSRRAFVVARPPGHHAEKAEAMGFCFFNTIACVAEFLLEQPGVERVFIVDWDVHHGNGTQHLFESRGDVFYSSIHHYPFYPGTGAAGERGIGKGAGKTLNIPLQGGSGDPEWLGAFQSRILPALDTFQPQAILISCGFDAHRRDPLGGMRVSESAYGTMTAGLVEAAERLCGGRILSLLEGGYDPEGLAASAAAHVTELNRESRQP